jgi:hypothetical protein
LYIVLFLVFYLFNFLFYFLLFFYFLIAHLLLCTGTLQKLECEGTSGAKGVSGQLVTDLSWLGLGFKETWKTDGTVTSEVSKKNFIEAKASKAVAEAVISPVEGLKKVTIKANVELADMHADIKASGSDIPKAVDLGFVYGFMGNWSLGFKASSKDITASNPSINKTLAGCYVSDAKDLTVYTEVGLDSNSLAGKVMHVTGPKATCGAQIASNNGTTKLSAVGLYAIDDLTTVKAGLDTDRVLNLASIHKVGAATISPSAVIKLGDQDKAGFGFSVTLEN